MAEVSIIIPVYKVEKYLSRCLDSVLNQTFTDFEVILVDDCSPDKSGEICDEYAKKDSRIKVIHREKNGGLSVARNSGLAVACGEFISFIDSDDHVTSDYLEKLLRMAKENGADIVHCGYYEDVNGNIKTSTAATDGDKGVVTSKQAFGYLYGDYESNVLNFMVWNKLFTRSSIDNLLFAEGLKSEDCIFVSQAIMQSKKVYISNVPLYYYFTRDDSIMGEMRKDIKELIKVHIKAYRQVALTAENCSDYFRNLSNARLANWYVSAIKNKMLKQDKQLKAMLKEDKKRFAFLKNKRISFIKRLILALRG